jgi:AcrR family transcriptional regulator
MSVTPTEQSAQKACKRAEIVAAAVRIADAEGVEAVSMRRLADELGVATMTPYTHVASKDELLDLMRDAVAAEMLLPEPLPDDWREALRSIAERTRAAYEAHPWCLDATPRRPRARINRLRHVEQSIGIVLRLGAEPETSRAVLLSIDDYVIGYCTRARSRQRMLGSLTPAGKDALRRLDDPDPEVAAALESGELPIIKRIAGRPNRKHPFGVPPDSGFEPGLDWLLDGIEASLAP